MRYDELGVRGVPGQREPALVVGARVPEIVFTDEQGRWKTLSSLRGRPVVIAFSPGWSVAESPRLDDQLRAELRGLGTVLLAIAADGIWLHQADDPAERYRLTKSSGGDLEALHHAFGIPTAAVALFVLDQHGAVRWRSYAESPAGGEVPAVLGALRTAGAAMRASVLPRPMTVGRREVMLSMLVAAFATVALDGCERKVNKPVEPPPPLVAPPVDSGTVAVKLNVNGTIHELQIEPRVTLLDALRERLGLTGTKKGCDHGQCGACTVLIDGQRMNSCLTLAIMHQSDQRKKITTIEGLAHEGTLHPMQTAFIECDAFQCGYCTPGQILSAVSLLSKGGNKTDDQIREQMSGNICRCGAYDNIVEAIKVVQGRA